MRRTSTNINLAYDLYVKNMLHDRLDDPSWRHTTFITLRTGWYLGIRFGQSLYCAFAWNARILSITQKR
jgi:hypothetical protein